MYSSFSLLTYPFFVVHSWNSLWGVTRCGRLLLHTTRPVKYLSETRWRWGAPTQTLHWFSISSDLVVLVHPRPIVSQIYSRNSDGEPFGWWLARIRMMIGEVILSLLQTKKNLPLHKAIFKKLLFLCFSQWCLIEYAAGGQEFVLPESIRPFNPNRFCFMETLVWSYCSEERNVRLQVGAHMGV